MSKLLKVCETIKEQINKEGHEFENTLEIITPRIDLRIDPMDLDLEEKEIAEYYGDKWLKRLEDEKFHYKKLRYSLLHAVKEIEYFHKIGIDNRKTIIFSSDCISSVQYIKRGTFTALVVFMRSSDVEALLPIDLLYLAKTLKAVNATYIKDREGLIEELTVLIGSAHIYTKGGRDESV